MNQTKKEIESFITKEINKTIEENKTKQRYELRYGEGYLAGLKKVQGQMTRIAK